MTPDEIDISTTAARDLDGPLRCSVCGQVKRVDALLDRGRAMCGDCWVVGYEEGER